MSRQSANSHAARQLLLERRDAIRAEITQLSGRLQEVEFLIALIDKPLPALIPPSAPTLHAPPPPLREDTKEKILTILKQAPKQQMTAQELAEAMKTPVGTASSRLAQIKKLGLVSHKIPYYIFVPPVH